VSSCYEFKDAQTGERYEVYMPASECVPIGEAYTADGRTGIRMPSIPQQVNVPVVCFTSRQLPDGYPYAKRWETLPDGKKGSPQFATKHEMQECVAKANAHGECLQWDSN
jgi:hypothetical protein